MLVRMMNSSKSDCWSENQKESGGWSRSELPSRRRIVLHPHYSGWERWFIKCENWTEIHPFWAAVVGITIVSCFFGIVCLVIDRIPLWVNMWVNRK